MRTFVCAFILLIACSVLESQAIPKSEKAPVVEIFGGFSYANYEVVSLTRTTVTTFSSFLTSTTTDSQTFSARLGTYGWNSSIGARLTPWFSLVTDLSGYYSNGTATVTVPSTIVCAPLGSVPCAQSIQVTSSNPRFHNFLFGPQYNVPIHSMKPFVHFLVGGSRRTIGTSETVTTSLNGVTTEQSLLVSRASSALFAMAAGGGVDLPLRHNLAWRTASDYLTGQGTGQNHFRLSSGIVWSLVR
jgi:hypothetical protein